MSHRLCPRLRGLLGYLSLLIVTVGCTPGSLIQTEPPTPDPAFAVTIDALVAEPARYANTLLVIQGYPDAIARPACDPWVGPPVTWSMSNEQQGSAHRSIEIKSAFPDGAQPIIPDSFYMKEQITLHGWLRRYDGPIGCPRLDAEGQAQYKWYFEAVQLESATSIKWHRPQDPTKIPPPPRPTFTPQPEPTFTPQP